MSEQFEVEAFNKADAMKQAHDRVPEDSHVGATLIQEPCDAAIYGWAETISEAREKAYAAVPTAIKIIKEETFDAWRETFSVRARSEKRAKSKVLEVILAKYAKSEGRSIDRNTFEGTHIWDTPVYKRIETILHTPQNPIVWRGLYKFIDQHIQITTVKKIDSSKLPVLHFLTPNKYDIDVLHFAAVRLIYKGTAKYRISVSDDPCKVGNHTWGDWSTNARSAKIGGGLTTAVGVRRCKRCQASEECSHRFGDWEPFNHESTFDSDQRITGKMRTCTNCGGSQFMHS
jgi:hypothetical protein